MSDDPVNHPKHYGSHPSGPIQDREIQRLKEKP